MGIRDHEAKRRDKSLDQLEGIASRPSGPGDTSLVTRCLRLRKVPIGELTVEDLRLMIGQREGLMFLVPLALEHLAADPLAEGSCYQGDLLCAVLRAEADFWRRHAGLQVKVERVVAELPEVPRLVAEALAQFRANTGGGSAAR